MSTEQDVIQRLAGQMMEAAKRERELDDQLYQAAFKIVALETVNQQLVAAVNRAVRAIENLGHAEGGLSGRGELESACDQMTAALAAAGEQP